MPVIHYKKVSQHVSQLLLSLLLLLALYFPTSLAGSIQSVFFIGAELLIIVILLLFLLLNNSGSFVAKLASVIVLVTLLLATLFSPLPYISLGVFPNFLAIALLFFLNLRSVECSKFLSVTFFFVNIINLLLAAGIILDIEPVKQVIRLWYASFYPELLPNMLGQNKPVLTFATHSIAGFMLLFFFYLNLKTYDTNKRLIFLFFAFGYLVACWNLSSVMGYMSCLLAVACLAYCFFPKNKFDSVILFYGIIPILFVVLALVFVTYNNQIAETLETTRELVEDKMLSPENGLLGRYAPGGVLGGNIQYIVDNPFRPTGLSSDEVLYFVDSGPVEYMLRGSFLMLIMMYVGFFAFLRYNLRSDHSTYFLFVILILAELGFSYLKYFRFQAILPFAIVYLNHLQQVKRDRLCC